MTNQDIYNFRVQDHQGGSFFYLDAPRSYPNFQVLPAAQWEERFLRVWVAQSGIFGGVQPGIGWSPPEQGFSEGSLLPTEAGNLGTEKSQRGVEGRGERDSMDKGSGGGSG